MVRVFVIGGVYRFRILCFLVVLYLGLKIEGVRLCLGFEDSRV